MSTGLCPRCQHVVTGQHDCTGPQDRQGETALPYQPCQPIYGSCALLPGHEGPHHGYPRNIAAIIAAVQGEVVARVERIFNLQCPPMPAENYVDKGAWMAHSWWNTVLGGELRDLRAALDAAERQEANP